MLHKNIFSGFSSLVISSCLLISCGGEGDEGDEGGENRGSNNLSYQSCSNILDAGESSGDGIYSIDADGDGPLSEFDVYCDMTIE